MKVGFLLLGFVLQLAGSGYAADWPHWRGPKRNGISDEPMDPNRIAAEPRVAWRASVGTGFSSLSISQGRVYTMGNANDEDTIWCLDAKTGKAIWKHTYPAKLGPVYYEGGPGSTPTVNDGRVYTIGKWGDVFCLDATNGVVIWHRPLSEQGIKSNRWGFAGAPLIWEELVILNAGSFGTALDRRTGKVVWFNGTEPTGYASPVLFRSGDRECVLIFAAKHLVGIEPRTGRELWRFPWETGYDTNNSDPLVYDDHIFISSYSAGCALLNLKSGQPKLVYSSKVLHNHLSPGILLGPHLYAFNGQVGEKTDFRCIHLPTGELRWTRPDPAMGTLICADGKLIILSEKGELVVAQPSPTELKITNRSQILGGRCWTPPALADGLLYARNANGDLRCIELMPPKPTP